MSKFLGVATLVTKEKNVCLNIDKSEFLDHIDKMRKCYQDSKVVHYLDGSVSVELKRAIVYMDLVANFKLNK